MAVAPTVIFKKYPDVSLEEICVVCRDPLDKDLVGHNCSEKDSKKVDHVFHKACAQGWVNEHQSCPTCRAFISESSIVRVLDISAIRRNVEDYDPDIRDKQVTASMLVSIFGSGAAFAVSQLMILVGMQEDIGGKSAIGVGILAFSVGSLFINKLVRFL